MADIFDKMESIIEVKRKEISGLLKEHGDKVVSKVTVSQIYGGMRGVTSLICDTSNVPNDQGLIIRERPLKNLTDKTPIELFYLLLTGEEPNDEEFKDFFMSIRLRKFVPHYVWDVLKAMPKDSHPMTMLSMALLSMQRESVFAQKYSEGIKKSDYWRYTLEDALNIVAKLPAIAAAVYRLRYDKGELIQPDPAMNFTQDFVHMMGIRPDDDLEFYNMMRLFLVSHADHEGGNVSAFTTLVVNSALSDLYYSLSAGFNGLAGPLHGLANQEVLSWILELIESFGGEPTEDQIKQYAKETLAAGRVIPGYGHAVLRVVDPRFTAFYEFGLKHVQDSPVFNTVKKVFNTVPDILKDIEKIKDPWPNVDAGSGSLLYHYGIKEISYYTVIFALSRAIGLAAQAVVNRAYLLPITRPKSVTTEWVKEFVAKN